MGLIIFLLLDFGILWLWHRYRKDKTKEPAWYWTWLGPTSVILLTIFTLLAASGTYIFVQNTFPLELKRTEREMGKIEKAIVKYHADSGHFPHDMEDLIGKNPIRKEWVLDGWGSEYQLTQEKNENVQLSSAGADMEFGTTDDLVIVLKP